MGLFFLFVPCFVLFRLASSPFFKTLHLVPPVVSFRFFFLLFFFFSRLFLFHFLLLFLFSTLIPFFVFEFFLSISLLLSFFLSFFLSSFSVKRLLFFFGPSWSRTIPLF